MRAVSMIDDLLNDNRNAKRRIQASNDMLKTAKAAKIMALVAATVGDGSGGITSYQFMSGESAYVNVHVKDLNGFKDERLATILTGFEYLGPDDTTTEDNAAYFIRSIRFKFKFPETDWGVTPDVYVTVEAKIKNDSETCERVVVGMTDPKPQPIYKLVCGDEVQPEPAPVALPLSDFQ